MKHRAIFSHSENTKKYTENITAKKSESPLNQFVVFGNFLRQLQRCLNRDTTSEFTLVLRTKVTMLKL